MNTLVLAGIALFGLLMLAFVVWMAKRHSNIDTAFFQAKWRSIIELAQNESTWVQAIVDADKLMDEALKQNKFPGKTTADRMVAANRSFSKPDEVWAAHKIRNKVVHETRLKLRKQHVHSSLRGFQTALKDLGAL